MRHKTSIVIGVCAALLLAGTVAGASAWTYAKQQGRSVGTWHDPPGVARSRAMSAPRTWPGTSSFEV